MPIYLNGFSCSVCMWALFRCRACSVTTSEHLLLLLVLFFFPLRICVLPSLKEMKHKGVSLCSFLILVRCWAHWTPIHTREEAEQSLRWRLQPGFLHRRNGAGSGRGCSFQTPGKPDSVGNLKELRMGHVARDKSWPWGIQLSSGLSVRNTEGPSLTDLGGMA